MKRQYMCFKDFDDFLFASRKKKKRKKYLKYIILMVTYLFPDGCKDSLSRIFILSTIAPFATLVGIS